MPESENKDKFMSVCYSPIGQMISNEFKVLEWFLCLKWRYTGFFWLEMEIHGTVKACLKYNCASAHLGKSEASADRTFCSGLNLLPLDKAGKVNQLGGRKEAYVAEQLPPSANKRSPMMQLGSHVGKKFHGKKMDVYCEDTICWCVKTGWSVVWLTAFNGK